MELTGAEHWGDRDVVSRYATSGFSDDGERLALEAAAPWARGDVLDVGIGGGRTTGLLRASARHYVGIEPSPTMLELARTRHPGAELLADDARTLATQPDDAFDLVVFSFNGLDSVDHDERAQVLRQLARVARPGARVLVSSLNRDGISFDEGPLDLRGETLAARARELAVLARHPLRTARSLRNARTTAPGAVDTADWSLRAMRAHEFRFLVHFAPVGGTIRMLRAAGLPPETLWSESGRRLDPETEHDDADWVQYLCRVV